MNLQEIQQFVMMAGDKLVTNSRKVAEHFGKRHCDVLRDYDRLDCSQEFNERNYASVEYIDEKGQLRRMVEMTKNGLIWLVMGYRGKKAARIKELYIDAFDAMLEYIQTGAYRKYIDAFAEHKSEKEKASRGSYAMLDWKKKKHQLHANVLEAEKGVQLSLLFAN